MNKIASLIAKYEGKKSQTSIGNIREILKIFSSILATFRFTKIGSTPWLEELHADIDKKANRLEKKFANSDFSLDEAMNFLLGIKPVAKKKVVKRGKVTRKTKS